MVNYKNQALLHLCDSETPVVRSIILPSNEGMTLYGDYITFGLTPLQGFTHVLARSINRNLSLISCLYLQFQFRWTTRRFGTVSYYIGYCALTYPITPLPLVRSLKGVKERGLIFVAVVGFEPTLNRFWIYWLFQLAYTAILYMFSFLIKFYS